MHKTVQLAIEAAPANLGVDFPGDPTPASRGVAEPFPRELFGGAAERDPCHYLGVDEVLRSPAHLPNAFIRLLPGRRKMLHDRGPQGSAAFGGRDALPRLKYRVSDLSIQIELKLLVRSITDPHRRRDLVPWQPGEIEFRQPALAAPEFAGRRVPDRRARRSGRRRGG